jgi:hypothetical protein
MSRQDALAKAPRKAVGATRIVICEEVFDIRIGSDWIAVLHPESNLSFEVERPANLQHFGMAITHGSDAGYLALKKAIWNKFSKLRSEQSPQPEHQ